MFHRARSFFAAIVTVLAALTRPSRVRQIVSFFSMGITLHPGDIIFTGTPSGVQLGALNPVWLTDGDVVETGLDQLGTCSNRLAYT